MMESDSAVAFFLSHFAGFILIFGLSYLAGSLALSHWSPRDHDERLFLNTSIGLGLVIFSLFFIALFGLLYQGVVVCFFSAVALFAFRRMGSSSVRFSISKGKLILISGILCVLLLIPFFLLAFYPPETWDEISYHLPYARHYVRQHGLAVYPYFRFPLYAHNINLLYSLALMFHDDILAHLLHAATAVLTALGLYHLGRQTVDRRTGLLAASIFLSSQLVFDLMRTSYIDLGLTLFVFLSFFCVTKWSISGDIRWTYLAGFAGGIALGCKYSGFLYVSLLAIWIWFESRKASTVGKFLLLAFLFGAPWYLRNFIVSGDPFSPLCGGIFGYSYWNQTDLQTMVKDMKSVGTPLTILSFLQLPWNLWVHPGLFKEKMISAGMLAFFPSLLFFKAFPPIYKKVTLFVFVNIIFWYYGAQFLRYLLPVFPLIALVSALVIIRVSDLIFLKPAIFWAKGRNRLLFLSKAAFAIPVALALAQLIATDVIIINQIKTNPIPVSVEALHSRLNMRLPGYSLVRKANQTPSLPLYTLGYENLFYYAKGKMMGDWYGVARYCEILPVLHDTIKLHEYLSRFRTKLFLIDTKRFGLSCSELYAPYFEVIAKRNHTVLFAVK